MNDSVLVVADNALAAEAIRRELRAAGIPLVGYVDGRRPCGDAVEDADPGIVVLDDMGGQVRAVARISEVRAAAPGAKLVLITLSMDLDWLGRASAAGIDAAIAKAPGLGLLLREVVDGHIFHAFDPLADQGAEPKVAGLTARETQVLGLVTAGASNARIASELGLSQRTVKYHLSKVFRKLGLTNRTEASHYAHVHRLFVGDTDTAQTSEAA
jgi:DNA-binding NarL/FixJ family response regulator